jgi:hypothetical protein
MHLVISLEESPRKLEQRAVAWVIEGFDSGYPLGKERLGLFYISHEFSLGIRRTGDQNRASLRDGLSHPLEELVVNRRMAAVTCVRLVMNVLVRMGTADGCTVDIRGVELKHLGFTVIDPYQCVVVVTHNAYLEGSRTCAQ